MMISVKNYPSSSRWSKPTCSCGTWIKHWKNNVYQPKIEPGVCSCCGEFVGILGLNGGHVQKVRSQDKHLYIVPLCSECNNSENTDEFIVDDSILASVTPCYSDIST